MSLDFSSSIDHVEHITRDRFQREYMNPQRPVVIKNFYGKDAPIYSKWTFDYFRDTLGDIKAGVYDVEGEQRKDDRSYKSASELMKFRDFLNLVEVGSSTKRLFLFNIFKHQSSLKKDFYFPDITSGVVRSFPLVFFGGEGAHTRIHQDMDMSNVFLTEVKGKKRIILFDPDQSDKLYRLPLGVHSAVDIMNPDYDKYPALDKVTGYSTVIGPRDTIFMPSSWWHDIYYLSPSVGMAMRSLANTMNRKLNGLYYVGLLTHIDDLLRNILGNTWHEQKKKIANQRAEKALSE